MQAEIAERYIESWRGRDGMPAGRLRSLGLLVTFFDVRTRVTRARKA